MEMNRFSLLALLAALALTACAGAMEGGYREGAVISSWESVELVWAAWPWGKALFGFSGAILVAIFFCTANAGHALRTGAGAAFAKLPPRADAEGLAEIRDRAESGPLHRALKVGLVAGRGGLLISKSAVLAAWEAERARFRQWPRVLIALGLVSLALGVLAASQKIPLALDAWKDRKPYDQYDALNQAHALMNWGLTNCFVALLLYYVFDRATQMLLDRSTLALIRYLGDVGEPDAVGFPSSPAAALKAGKDS